jgi:hypothetical protein
MDHGETTRGGLARGTEHPTAHNRAITTMSRQTAGHEPTGRACAASWISHGKSM